MRLGDVSGMPNACGRGKRAASRSWSGLTSECRGGVNTGNKVSSCTTERIEQTRLLPSHDDSESLPATTFNEAHLGPDVETRGR